MLGAKIKRTGMALGVAGCLMVLSWTEAQAVPSFARQTGMACNACHTVYPELTPFGRTFKLDGYTLSKSGKSYEFPPPISAGAQFSFTQVQKSMPPKTAPEDSRGNDNVNVPQNLSLYYGGKIYSHLGTLTQGMYDGVSNKFLLYQSDVRYARTTTLGDQGLNLIYGLTLNNNPTVQDVWNSTPARSFHYVFSEVGPFPAAGAQIDNALGLQVGGLGVYAFWHNLAYVEVCLYRTARQGPFQFLGAGTVTAEMVDGFAPYWRLALQHNWQQHSVEVGTYGMAVQIFPEGQSRGARDRFTDVAWDAQYQYILKKQIFSAQATWIHEEQDRGASFALGNAAQRSNSLDTFRMNLNYWYRSHIGTLGGTVGYFSTTGTRDASLYPPNIPLYGSRTGRPNTDGFVLEADYLPWDKTKISLLYIIYDRFNGAHTNYDGLGRNAPDNNTLYLNLWLII
jgi:hypothetical protein